MIATKSLFEAVCRCIHLRFSVTSSTLAMFGVLLQRWLIGDKIPASTVDDIRVHTAFIDAPQLASRMHCCCDDVHAYSGHPLQALLLSASSILCCVLQTCGGRVRHTPFPFRPVTASWWQGEPLRVTPLFRRCSIDNRIHAYCSGLRCNGILTLHFQAPILLACTVFGMIVILPKVCSHVQDRFTVCLQSTAIDAVYTGVRPAAIVLAGNPIFNDQRQ